jgi:hypothetical protein
LDIGLRSIVEGVKVAGPEKRQAQVQSGDSIEAIAPGFQ